MNGPEIYKHKLKIKHIKYGIQNYNNHNINSTRNKESFNFSKYNYNNNSKEILKFRGNSCGTNRYNNKLNEDIYTKTVCGIFCPKQY